METLLLILLSIIVTAIVVVVVLKVFFHWVDVNKIPEKEIEQAAMKMMKEKFEKAEREVAEMKAQEERKLRR